MCAVFCLKNRERTNLAKAGRLANELGILEVWLEDLCRGSPEAPGQIPAV